MGRGQTNTQFRHGRFFENPKKYGERIMIVECQESTRILPGKYRKSPGKVSERNQESTREVPRKYQKSTKKVLRNYNGSTGKLSLNALVTQPSTVEFHIQSRLKLQADAWRKALVN